MIVGWFESHFLSDGLVWAYSENFIKTHEDFAKILVFIQCLQYNIIGPMEAHLYIYDQLRL